MNYDGYLKSLLFHGEQDWTDLRSLSGVLQPLRIFLGDPNVITTKARVTGCSLQHSICAIETGCCAHLSPPLYIDSQFSITRYSVFGYRVVEPSLQYRVTEDRLHCDTCIDAAKAYHHIKL